MNKNLRNILAFFGLAESQDKIEWQKWDAEQRRKFEDGEEIEPPWVFAPNTEPWSGEWKQGGGEYWIHEFWNPFWSNLDNKQKRNYLEKWNPPEDWYQQLVCRERKYQPNEEIRWFKEQARKLEAAEEIEPPWIAFPISSSSFGWDDGETERWKLEIWTPFWEKLSKTEKEQYLEKWEPPNSQWAENIIKNWVGKIRKTDSWFEKQKSLSKIKRGYINYSVPIPWFTFPEISAEKTEWDKEFVEKWKNEIWLPYRRSVTGNEFKDDIESYNLPDNWENYLGIDWTEK
jgi:hypothetical protein